MKTMLGLFGAALCVGSVLLAANKAPVAKPAEAQALEVPPAKWPGNKFVVHEWGTFTSFSGSNSVKLEFRPLVDSDLPFFVLDRRRQSGDLEGMFLKGYVSAMQRMETPVTYFYSDRPRQVNVRVDFPRGLLTEFYPPVEKMQPDFRVNRRETLSGSSLDWGKLWIVPEDRLQAKLDDAGAADKIQTALRRNLLPAATGQDHYAYARETDSALVYVERARDKNRPVAPQGSFFEKFLFYRGLGNFELPLKMTAHAENQFELENIGSTPIRSLFLVTVEGNQLRYVKQASLAAGQRLKMTQAETFSPADGLAADMVQALKAEGLYEKEALAMVKTWRDSWFIEQGTRLFYLLPQEKTDELLPLYVTPRPDEVVRVMVGRLEIMRPEDEARIIKLVKQSALDRLAHGKISTEQKPFTPPKAIVDLGRLAEPALARVKNVTRDQQVHTEANLLLWQLRSR